MSIHGLQLHIINFVCFHIDQSRSLVKEDPRLEARKILMYLQTLPSLGTNVQTYVIEQRRNEISSHLQEDFLLDATSSYPDSTNITSFVLRVWTVTVNTLKETDNQDEIVCIRCRRFVGREHGLCL